MAPSPPAHLPRVAVILVNWNGSTETLACIRSLQDSEVPVWRTYVVDNASTDGSAEHLRHSAAKAHLIRSDTNLGYAGAFNLAWPVAIRHGAEYVWLLNNDTQVTRTALTHLLEAAMSVGPALLSPQIRYQDPPEQIWYLGGRLDWRMKTFHITRRDPSPTAEARGLAAVEWATGCSLFMSAHSLETVGPMDERYFLYLEDVDWSLSARRRGLAVYTVPRAIIHHGLASSVKRLQPWHVHYYAWRNYYLIAQKHGKWWQKIYAYTDLAVRLGKTVARLLMYPSYRHDLNYLARSRGLIDFLRRRFGPFPSDELHGLGARPSQRFVT